MRVCGEWLLQQPANRGEDSVGAGWGATDELLRLRLVRSVRSKGRND